MKKIVNLSLAAAIILIAFMYVTAEGSSKEVAKINDAVEVLDDIMAIPEKGMPPALLNKAQGIAIIPGVIKAGFIVGGRHGSGVVVVRNSDGNWSNPSFITLTGGSIGWQIGAQSTDIILVFKTRKGINNMIKGKFTLGADAAVAAGPVGRQAEAGTDLEFKSEIYSYSRTRGLFAGISLEGAALQIDNDANAAFYGEATAKASDILTDKEIKTPAIVNKLKETLTKYTPGKARN